MAATTTEGSFEVDGVKLYTKTWTPADCNVKAKLVFVHGYSEHINRYNDWFPLLCEQGIEVFSWDQRGWGRSTTNKAERGLTGPTSRVIADIAAVLKDRLPAEGDNSSPPTFLMGHSMGGGEVCTLAGDAQYDDLVKRIRGLILHSPFIGFTPQAQPNPLTVLGGRLVGRLFPKRQMVQKIEPSDVTRIPEIAADMEADEMCHNTGTLEGLAGLLDRTGALSSGACRAGPNVKSLFHGHGTADKVCSYDLAVKWVDEQTGVPDKTFKSYEGGYHQLHADLCGKEFAADVGAWILARSGGQPVADTPAAAKL